MIPFLPDHVLRSPWLLLLAALLPLAWFLRRRAGEAGVTFAPAPFVLSPAGDSGPFPRSWRVALVPLPGVLAAVGALLLVVALARPAHRALVPVETRGIDVVLCLDTSSSMKADDLQRGRTRLDVAKEAAARFVRGRENDRVGLVTFARFADVRCPPTRDRAALESILDAVTTVDPDGPEDATAIGAAVARAADLLRERSAPSRVVVLLTDGEENVATAGAKGEIAPAHAAQLGERLGVRVHAIVVGGEAGAVAGRPPPDTRETRKLAARTGGGFHEAKDARALADVYEAIDALETSPHAASRAVLEDRFLPFLVAGVVLLLLARLLASSRLDPLP